MNELSGENVSQLLQGNGGKREIKNAQIRDTVSVFLAGTASAESILIENCEFFEAVEFSADLDTNVTVRISNTVFHERFDFVEVKGSLHIRKCCFKNLVSIEGINTGIAIIETEIERSASFEGEFNRFSLQKTNVGKGNPEGRFTLTGTVSQIAGFYNCILVNSAFTQAIFKEYAIFDKVEFISTEDEETVFAGCEFEQDFHLRDCKLSSHFTLSNVLVKGMALLSGINGSSSVAHIVSASFQRAVFDDSKWQTLQISHSDFSELASFKNMQVRSFILFKTYFPKAADFLDADIHSYSRETYRIIKNEFIKINNQVEAQEYRTKELLAYENELKHKKQWGEYSLLWLNRLSNYHNKSWARGLLFTVVVSLAFYLVYLGFLGESPFTWQWNSWPRFWEGTSIAIKNYIQFLDITHKFDFMQAYKPTAANYVLDFIAKIFIGYGIYQTIQAFRKHGKG